MMCRTARRYFVFAATSERLGDYDNQFARTWRDAPLISSAQTPAQKCRMPDSASDMIGGRPLLANWQVFQMQSRS
jgi:hypothetical protein